MSRHRKSTQSDRQTPLGVWLRKLRRARKLPLRAVAAAAEMDSTLLSKIELGERLPTEPQTSALARFFAVPIEDMQARRIADKFWNEHRDTPAAQRAISIIKAKADAGPDRAHG